MVVWKRGNNVSDKLAASNFRLIFYSKNAGIRCSRDFGTTYQTIQGVTYLPEYRNRHSHPRHNFKLAQYVAV